MPGDRSELHCDSSCSCNTATLVHWGDIFARHSTGGGNKFVVRRSNDSGLYVTLSNPQTTAAQGRDQRSVLALTVSEDMRTWRRQIHFSFCLGPPLDRGWNGNRARRSFACTHMLSMGVIRASLPAYACNTLWPPTPWYAVTCSVAVVLDDDTGFSYADSLRYTGFHYVARPVRTVARRVQAQIFCCTPTRSDNVHG